MGVTQKSWFRRNRFCRVTPAQFIRYLKSFHKANLDINKPLALYVRIFSAKDTLKFLRITYARTHQEVSRKTKLIGLCLLLRLWVLIYTLFKNLGPFCQYQQLYLLKINFLFELSVSKKFLCSIADSKHCGPIIIYRYRDKIFKKFSTLLKNYKDNIIINKM